MPQRSLFKDPERDTLLALPKDQDSLIRFYTFSESDLAIIKQHRGNANRLGFAVQLCYARYPGMALPVEGEPGVELLEYASQQLQIVPSEWGRYLQRDVTRREHLLETQSLFKYKTFSLEAYQHATDLLEDLAWQTDKGIVLAEALIQHLRSQSILLPSINVIERICAEAITKATRRIYYTLTEPLTQANLKSLDSLLELKPESSITLLSWLRQPSGTAKAQHILEHIDRLQIIRSFGLPDGLEKAIHQNRLLKIAREGRQMTPQDLGKFEQKRRYATLAAVIMELQATVTDEIIDQNDRIIGSLFSKAKRSHEQQLALI
jgi:TnpA family transposase